MPGGRIDIAVEPDLRGFPQKLEGGLQGAVGTASKVGRFIGLSLGAATIAATGKQIIQIGNDYTTSLNTMQAVSSATADQMAQVSERAKQLGNDISLPNTSASDAAAAMTELAKGGFSVQQSMDAAKGTLQLAAAAQVDAATAATIQSQALQAFGLNADYASTAADVLANTANASSAEITDVASGLQQAGTVANQFGVSMEDTATTIGLFANAGITGSDAGTLMKSALLALTDQGKPAQAAIEELGLTVYDAQGKFVGMRSLFEQLQVASQGMTDEQYQAATATLFGSDAMRLAGVAAEQGVVGYDKMRDAIGRQGAAADVAAAKTQGLPGALSAAQNAAENLALQVYDLVDGPLESLANGFASFVSGATPAIVGGLSAIGGAAADVGSFFLGLPGPVQAATAALVAMKVTGLGGLIGDLQGRGASALAGFNNQMRLQQQLAQMSGQEIGRVSAALSVLEARVPVLGRMGDAYRSVYTPAASFASQQVALASASGPITGSLRAAAGEAVRFGGAIGGTAMAGIRGFGSAISGVTAALGGPWVLGLSAAVAVTTQLISAGQRAGQVMDTYRRSVDDVAKANGNLRQALVDSNGLVNDQVVSVATSKIDALRASSQQMADQAPGIWGMVSTSFATLGGTINDAATESYDAAERMSASGGRIVEAMDKTGLSSTELGKIVTGDSTKFLNFTQSLLHAGGASVDLAGALMDQRDAFLEARSSAGQVKDAIEQIETKAVGAAGGVDSLTNAVGRLREDGRTAESAQKALTLALDSFRQSATSGGVAAVDAAGKIDLSTTAGVRLDDQMSRVASAWDQAGAAARTSAAEQGLSAEDTEAAVRNAQQQVRDQFIQTATEAGLTQQQAEALANVFLTWPPEAKTKITVLDEEARAKVEAFLRDNSSKTIDVLVRTTMLNETPRGLPPTVAPSDLSGLMLPRRATGGPITGGVPGKDSVLLLGMPGEHMLTTDEVDMLGGQEGTYRFRAALRAGQIGKFAVGGAVGQVASQRAHEFLAAQNGMEYGYAQVGNPSWDCSSYSSAGYALLTGRDPYTRWYTTESDFPSLGFLPGLGPRSALNLGVHNGGGGPNSHMTSMLGGIPFESSSSGVRYGSGAASPSDPQFENHWHLPASRFSPPEDDSDSGAVAYGTGQSTKKKATWTEKNDLELDSARIAVQQAIEARDRTNANEKKSQADRDQAANKVAQAEQRVKDLEAKKSAAESGADAGPAPAAPPLESNLTDDEIRLRELQRAINKADVDRNEVYDDPERVSEREDADLALQRAINALAAEQKRQAEELRTGKSSGSSSTGEARSLSQMLGDVASEFVTSNVSDLFSVLGVNDSGLGRLVGLGVGIADWAQDPRGEKSGVGPATAPFFSKEEIDSQAPAVPGTPEWATAMANLMAFPNLLKEIPTVLRDTGGPLPHGVAGLNLSGETEWVLTGDQRRQYEADRRDLAALRAERSSAGGLARADIPHLAQQLSEAIGRPIAVNNYAPGGDGVEHTLVKVEQRRVGRVRLSGR